MKFFAPIALILQLAAASPAAVPRQGLATPSIVPGDVQVIGVSLLGTGCPPKSADVQVDATKTLMEITFSEYIVQTGPGTKASEWRKNCKLTLNLAFSEGFQFATLSTEMRGYAQVPKNTRAICTNTFDFTGIQGQANYGISLAGEREGPFTLKADPDVVSWSPCGGTTAIMNMNTQCSISPTQNQALIAVDRISGKITVQLSIEWRKCK